MAMTQVALCQLRTTCSASENLRASSSLVAKCAHLGSQIIFLPENCCFMGTFPGESNGHATSMSASDPASLVAPYASLAKEHGVWLSLGGVQEDSGVPMEGSDPPKNKVNNSHVLIDPQGQVASVYRKIHLFDVDLSATGGPKLLESSFTNPGDPNQANVVPETPMGSLGLAICYDMRFPYLFQRLRFEKGADVLTAPSAYTVPTGRAHWHALLRSRAIENQCFMVAAAQVGRHWPGKRLSYGHSIIIDPWGAVVADLGGASNKTPVVPEDATLVPLEEDMLTAPTPDAEKVNDEESVEGAFVGAVVVNLTPETLASTRAKMPVASHRRPFA
ncbi:nitrilase [Pycnococcus provasolii]